MSLRSRLYILVGAILTWLSLHDLVALHQYDQYLQMVNGTQTALTTTMSSPMLYTPKGLNPYIPLALGTLCVVIGLVVRFLEKKKKAATRALRVAAK